MKFTLQQTSNVTIETAGSSGDTQMWLYGPNDSAPSCDDDDSGNGAFSRIERAGQNALPPGTYFLKVDEFGTDNIIANYTIAVTATAAQPEINVEYQGHNIADGDTTPRPDDGTDFGRADVVGGDVTATFTIQNLGGQTLNLTGSPLVRIVGANAADFTVAAQPTTPVASGGSVTFQVRFDPRAAGLRTATIQIANDDADEGLFDFAISGTGTSSVVSQWAGSVIAYSSQYSSVRWSASQALGAPNVTAYGDNAKAWGPSAKNGTTEYITLGYGVPVYADQVTVRETCGNGFVTSTSRFARLVRRPFIRYGREPTRLLQGARPILHAPFATTSYLVDAVRVTIDTNHSLGGWEEIDAVQLRGSTGLCRRGRQSGCRGWGKISSTGIRRRAYGRNGIRHALQGGTPVWRIFTVWNTGTATLTLGTPSLPAGFAVTESLNPTIDPGRQRYVYSTDEHGERGNVPWRDQFSDQR